MNVIPGNYSSMELRVLASICFWQILRVINYTDVRTHSLVRSPLFSSEGGLDLLSTHYYFRVVDLWIPCSPCMNRSIMIGRVDNVYSYSCDVPCYVTV